MKKLLVGLIFLHGLAHAEPLVVSVSTTFTHRSNVVISGLGFGEKAVAAPAIWDDASGADINDKWDGAWPSNNPIYNLAYRTPQRGIALPHGNITRYIAGAHAEDRGAQGGYAVIMYKTRPQDLPSYTYVSWYQRVDDAWVFGYDNNFEWQFINWWLYVRMEWPILI